MQRSLLGMFKPSPSPSVARDHHPFEENAAVMEALRKRGDELVNKAFNDEFREQRAKKRKTL